MHDKPDEMFFVQFLKKEQIASDIFCFYFLLPKKFFFLPGQYVQLTIPHAKTDERGSSRFFTIASSPSEKDYLMITTRKGQSSFKKALFQLQKGTTVQCFGPMGKFILEAD